jgi:heat shock protein HslJ
LLPLVAAGGSGADNGSLGCNPITAEATVRDGRITLGTPGAARRMCDGSLMGTERSLPRLFKSGVDYRIEHCSMALTSENGKGFSAVAAE